MGHAAARRSRRRGDQDRGPGLARRRRPLRAAVRGGRGLALLRDVQPQQEEHLSRPPPRRRSRRARGPRAPLRRRLLEPARRPARAARPDLRAARAREPADRLLLALRLRDDRAARRGRRLRLHDARARRLDVADRRPRRPAHQERAVARRPLGRLRLGDRRPGGRLARAPRRRRLRLRRLALRDGAARALLRRHVGGVARLRAAAAAELCPPVDRAVPELRDGRRLDRRRLPEAEVLGGALWGARPAGARTRPALRRLRGARP